MRTELVTEPSRRRWRSEIAVRVTIVVASLAIALAALEVGTRIVFDRHGMHFGIEMWKYATQVKRRSSVAEMGHEHAPNRQAVLMGVEVRTNSLGLRDREYPVQKPRGVHRILVLGDSMTFGWGAREEHTYPKVLERLLNQRGARRYEVINAGVGNYNTVQEVAYFRERGRQLQPDEVILGYFINDAEPNPSPSGNVLTRHLYSYVLATSLWDALARQAGWKPSLTSYYSDLYGDDSAGWRAARHALGELAQLCRSSHVKLSIALIPELHAPNEQYPFKQAHAGVVAAAAKEGVPVIDLLPAFADVPPRSLWVSPGDAHANARGHEIIAQALFRTLVEGGDPTDGQVAEEDK